MDPETSESTHITIQNVSDSKTRFDHTHSKEYSEIERRAIFDNPIQDELKENFMKLGSLVNGCRGLYSECQISSDTLETIEKEIKEKNDTIEETNQVLIKMAQEVSKNLCNKIFQEMAKLSGENEKSKKVLEALKKTKEELKKEVNLKMAKINKLEREIHKEERLKKQLLRSNQLLNTLLNSEPFAPDMMNPRSLFTVKLALMNLLMEAPFSAIETFSVDKRDLYTLLHNGRMQLERGLDTIVQSGTVSIPDDLESVVNEDNKEDVMLDTIPTTAHFDASGYVWEDNQWKHVEVKEEEDDQQIPQETSESPLRPDYQQVPQAKPTPSTERASTLAAQMQGTSRRLPASYTLPVGQRLPPYSTYRNRKTFPPIIGAETPVQRYMSLHQGRLSEETSQLPTSPVLNDRISAVSSGSVIKGRTSNPPRNPPLAKKQKRTTRS